MEATTSSEESFGGCSKLCVWICVTFLSQLSVLSHTCRSHRVFVKRSFVGLNLDFILSFFAVGTAWAGIRQKELNQDLYNSLRKNIL